MGTDESHAQQVVEMVAQLALRHEDQLQLVRQDTGFGSSCVSRRRCPCSPNFTKWGEADDGLQNGRSARRPSSGHFTCLGYDRAGKVYSPLRGPHVGACTIAGFLGTDSAAVDQCSHKKSHIPTGMHSDTPGEIFSLRPKESFTPIFTTCGSLV